MKTLKELKHEREVLLSACKTAYRKHHKGDASIGWEELSDILHNAICEAIGDKEFVKWNEADIGKTDMGEGK